MVSKSFEINASALPPFDSSTKKLMIELNGELVTVILIDRQTNKLEAIESFRGKHSTALDWEAMLQQSRLLALTDLETFVVIGYLNMMPVPAALYAPEQASAQLELFFGPAASLFTSGDVLKEPEMVIAWQIPLEEHDFLVNHFQWLQMKHAVSIMLENYIARTEADGHILIYGSTAWLMLWKSGEFMLARPVRFTKADDLSWYLLDTCRKFDLEPNGVNWLVSGMIEEDSSLWHALMLFMEPVSAMSSSNVPKGLPPHYFAHLFKTL